MKSIFTDKRVFTEEAKELDNYMRDILQDTLLNMYDEGYSTSDIVYLTISAVEGVLLWERMGQTAEKR